MVGLFTWFVSCLLVACLFPSFFCGRLCSFVYTGAKRKGAIERAGPGFLGRGLFTRRHRCSLPSAFASGCVQLVGGKCSRCPMDEMPKQNGRNLSFPPCCPVSASRLFSSCRVGFVEGRMTAWLIALSGLNLAHNRLLSVVILKGERILFQKQLSCVFCRYIPGPDPISGCCHCTGG